MPYDFGDLAAPAATPKAGKYDFGDLAAPKPKAVEIPRAVSEEEPGLEGVVAPIWEKAEQVSGDIPFNIAQKLGAPPQVSAALGAAGQTVPDILTMIGGGGSGLLRRIPEELPADLAKAGKKVIELPKKAYEGTEKFVKSYYGKEAKKGAEAMRSAVTGEAEKAAAAHKELSKIAGKHLERVKGMSGDAAKEVTEAVEATKRPEMANLFTPRPTEEIGRDIQAAVQKTQKEMAATRSSEIEKMRQSMRTELMQKEALSGEKVQGTPAFRTAMKQLDGLKRDFSANKTILGKLQDYEKRLTGAPNFDVLSDEIKAIREEAFKLEGSGFSTKFKALADNFEESLKQFSPEYRNMIARYPEISQPLEVMESKAGKAALRTGGFTGEARNVTDAADLPKVIFKNQTNYRDFVSASGLPKAEADRLALDYFKGEISGKSSTAARQFMDDHAAMMRELPEVKAALERDYIAPMQKFEHQVGQAAEHAKEKQEVIKGLMSKRSLTKQAAEKLATKYENALKPIQDSRTAEEAMKKTENLVYDLSNDGLISEAKRKELISQIQRSGDALEEHRKAVEVAKKAIQLTAYGLGTGLIGYWGSAYVHDYFRGAK